LNRYLKYGYLHRVGIKKPYHYKLTPLGKEHAKNPFLHREIFRKKMEGYINNKLEEEIAEILLDPATTERLADTHPHQAETIYRTLTEHLPTPIRDKILTDTGAAPTPPSTTKSSRELQLEAEVLRLRKILFSQVKGMEQQEIAKTHKKPQNTKNIQARYEIMKKYTDKQLFAKFFDFPEVPFYPYRVIASSSISELAKKKFKKGDVVVLDDRTAAKMVEMSLIKRLTAKEISELHFMLKPQIDGFYVRSTTFYIEKCIFNFKDITREKEEPMSIAPPEINIQNEFQKQGHNLHSR
jgi:hypothetical protein